MGKKKKADEEKSVTSVVVGLVVVIFIAGWGCMASSYEAAHAPPLGEDQELDAPRGRVSGLIMLIRALIIFADTAISQIPNLLGVIGWHLQHRIWLPIVIVLLAGCAVLFGFGLKMMEGVADDPYKNHRAKRAKRESYGDEPVKNRRPKKKRRRKPSGE